MSKTTTSTASASTLAAADLPDAGTDTSLATSTADQPCLGCAEKSGTCADCAAAVQAEPQAIPTPTAGGRYMRAEDGTLTPIKE